MSMLPITQASEVTGWSARMLRYVERLGLVEPERSGAGYRLYGPGQLQRLRTLRELLDRFSIGLSDVAFAARLRTDPDLRAAVDGWLTAPPRRPDDIDPGDWLRWEQDKHQRLLAPAPDAPPTITTLKETA
jgi:MerR family copper efflux transcriptional regulator